MGSYGVKLSKKKAVKEFFPYNVLKSESHYNLSKPNTRIHYTISSSLTYNGSLSKDFQKI